MKTFSSKSNAKRAFNKTDLVAAEFEIVQNSAGQWYWLEVEIDDETEVVKTVASTPWVEAAKVEEVAPLAEVEVVTPAPLAEPATAVLSFADELKAQLGYDVCPHCQCDFENGVDSAESMIDEREPKGRQAFGHAMRKEFLCLACNGEFGDDRTATKPVYVPQRKKAVGTGTGIKIQKNRLEQNGVKMPSEGGTTHRIWVWCIDFTSTHGGPPTSAEVRAWGVDEQGINKHTVSTQYAAWRKFAGVTGQIKSVIAPTPTAEA